MGHNGANTTNHLLLTARDAGTDEACAIGYAPAFCNKSIKSPQPVYENGPWQGHAIHFNKGCRLKQGRSRKIICKSQSWASRVPIRPNRAK